MHPTLEQIAAEYAHRLRLARDKRRALRGMVEELNQLPLTRADKHRIVDLVNEELGGTQRPPGDWPTPRSGSDNVQYLDLVKALKGLIR